MCGYVRRCVHIVLPVGPRKRDKFVLVGEEKPLCTPVPLKKEKFPEQCSREKRGNPRGTAVRTCNGAVRCPCECIDKRIQMPGRKPELIADHQEGSFAHRREGENCVADR
jgi:hypothetical protein